MPEAESIYQQILQADPSQPVALHLLGVIAHQNGKNDVAEDFITKAVALKPDYAEAHANLGNVLRELGRPEDAVVCCRKAIALQPDFAAARNNMGNALQELGRLDEAVASYEKSLAIEPDPEVHLNLGSAYQELGQLDDSVACCREALVRDLVALIARIRKENERSVRVFEKAGFVFVDREIVAGVEAARYKLTLR